VQQEPSSGVNPLNQLVSIIIPTYNRRDLLPEAVESCLAQSWSDREIIIVDDGSTDGTDRFVQERLTTDWAEKGIRYVLQPNCGASAARNSGLALATGDYIQFLDSDDLLFPSKLEQQIAVLESSENRVAAGCSCYGKMGPDISESNVRVGVHCSDPRQYLHILCGNMVHAMPTPAPLWRRCFLMQQGRWRTDIGLGDDLEFHVRLLSRAQNMCFVDQVLFFVRDHGGPRLSDARANHSRLRSALATREAIYETLRSVGEWDAIAQKNFLSAMRTLYANTLDCGEFEDISKLEGWLLELSRHPHRHWTFPLIITIRHLVGRKVLLGAHRAWATLRPT
jgi:glycosyltransferase involved in cell wall biosynthesis